jgi:hypothetical protein
LYQDADKSLARPTPRYILFDGENISFDASLVIYINSINIPPIMIINRIYETQNLLSLYIVSFLVGLRTYQHPCIYIYIYSTNIPPIMIINRIYEHENFMSL